MPDGIVYLKERPKVSVGDNEIASVDLTDLLDSDETISSFSVDPVEFGTSDLTLGAGAITAAAEIIKNRSVDVAKAIQWTVSGQQAGTTYKIHFAVLTSASRTIKRGVYMVCAP